MIGSLRGRLLDRSPDGEVLVEVAGVGYRAIVPTGTLASLGDPGSEVMLHTHLHVRDDALVLYGFPSREERACFEALLAAHGVGPALALAILSVHRPDSLRRVVLDGEVDALCLVPGVGRKTAARLLLELQNRFDGVEATIDVTGAEPAGTARSEVRAALASLGYGPDEVHGAVTDLPAEGDVGSLLREALSRLASTR